tara:strand:+ start:150 stop:497 length:348 start_codon:yes stop_codon:yes gene_type:complete
MGSGKSKVATPKPVVPDWEGDYEHGQRVYVFQKNLTANLQWSDDETLMEYTRRVSAIPDFLLVGEGIVEERLSVPVWSGYTGTLGDSVVYRVQMQSGSESGVCHVKSCHLARYER